MGKTKRVLDSVHGYITIPEELCDNVIDTPFFQRLRRIEQTSCRVLFPSARHDRFIHSLGVYHLGAKIVGAINRNCEGALPKNYEYIEKNYLIACLLHDVSHTPFSHTFEDFYDNALNNLADSLAKILQSDGFNADRVDREWKAAPHETMSAILAVTCFPDFVKAPDYDLEFIARMIVGFKYSDPNKSFENAFVELLHSKILDADGLDYACRDAAMAGYSTNMIDVDRLLEEIYVVKDKKDGDKYKVCFSNKAINEIESVLGVKHFQQYNVFAHHIVTYDQELLKEAMKSAAYLHLTDKETLNPKEREDALKTLCNMTAFTHPYTFGTHKIPLLYPSDDDFVSLMKYFPDEYYIHQWLTRHYELQPLWKSKTEFKHIFGDSLGATSLTATELWVFSPECKKFLCEQFDIAEHNVWLLRPEMKDRFGSASNLNVYIGGDVKQYNELYPRGRMYFNDLGEQFKYIFIPNVIDKNKVLQALVKVQRTKKVDVEDLEEQ